MRGLSAACALALIAVTIASLTARLHWTLELFSHFRWQYVMSAAATIPLCWLCGRRFFAIACCAVLSVHLAALLQQRFATVGRVPADGHTLRIVSFNVYFKNDGYREVMDYVLRVSPDVLCLYETTPAWEHGLAPLKARYAFALFSGDGPHSGIACMSRIVPTKIVPPTPDSGLAPWMQLDLESRGVRFEVVAAHLSLPFGSAGSAARNRQLQILARQLRKQSEPVLLVGDFNLSPYSPFSSDFVADSRLSDCSRGRPPDPTWPTGFAPLWIQIDRCFTAGDLAVARYAVGPAIGSDHYPVVIDFALRQSDARLARAPVELSARPSGQ